MANSSQSKNKRQSISKKLRFDVFKRDGFECQYCGAHPPASILHCDHINPVANGGKNDIDNLITSCDACNLGKGARLLSVVPQSLSSKAADIAEREEQIAGYQSVMAKKRERIDGEAYEILKVFCEQYFIDGIPKQNFTAIKNFIQKLGYDEVIEASEIAIGKLPYSYSPSFKYFCGICWSKLRELTEGC